MPSIYTPPEIKLNHSEMLSFHMLEDDPDNYSVFIFYDNFPHKMLREKEGYYKHRFEAKHYKAGDIIEVIVFFEIEETLMVAHRHIKIVADKKKCLLCGNYDLISLTYGNSEEFLKCEKCKILVEVE